MKRLFLGLVGFLFLLLPLTALASPRDDFKDHLESRQKALVDAFDKLDIRVKAMNSNDPKKDLIENYPDPETEEDDEINLLDRAEGLVEDFKDLDAGGEVRPKSEDEPEGFEGPYEASRTFLNKEEDAKKALNAVNAVIIGPARPANVPEGDLVEDFIPQVIRQLFRFTWLAILIGFIVAAILLITSADNEERHTQAKKILTYSLIGFVFVALAFALVKAITAIDFFGFI